MKDQALAHAHEDSAQETAIEFAPALSQPELVRSARELLEGAGRQLIEANRHAGGRAVCQRHSRFHDNLFRAIHKWLLEKWEAEGKGAPGSLALVALGGYGRRDLALRSDIDLLFLIGDRPAKQEEFVKEFLYVLYDLKFELGSVVRRLADCLDKIGADLESTTAMMESRWLAGSRPLFQHYHEVFGRALRARGRKWFLQTKFREWHSRHEKYDSSIYWIEPNIKEGAGGLRDIHSVRWALWLVKGTSEFSGLEEMGILSAAETRQFRHAEDFLLRLRNEIHAISPRKNDALTFDVQIELAKRLGFEGTETLLPAEAMMQEYYERAREIKKFSNRAFMALMGMEKSSLGALIGTLRRKKIDARFFVQDEAIFLDEKKGNVEWLREDPARIMALFARAKKMGVRVSERTREIIEEIVPGLDDPFRENPACLKPFMEIMEGPFYAAQTLADMHDCGFLCGYIPEFERIRCMARMDHYHRYTVDEHLIKCVEFSERLLREPEGSRTHAAQVAHEIKRLDLLNLSLLLHDVGKGFGKGHALRGGQIVQRIGNRIGLPPDDVDVLRFLVLSHLKISHVAQRRDLDDPAVARELAEEVGTMERLKLLYVHSVCDLLGVSPEAMTEWKSRLYEMCYRITAHALEKTGEAPPDRHGEHVKLGAAQRIWDRLIGAPPEGWPGEPEELERLRHRLDFFLENVPDRYLQSTPVELVAEHFWMIQNINDQELILWSVHDGLGFTEIAVVAADVPGSFAKTCGALAAKDINILSAQIFSTSDGYAINRFQVTDLRNQPLPQGFRLDRIRADLNQVFLEKKTMHELMEKYKARPFGSRPAPAHPRAAEIRLDNDASQEYSILEIRTGDRPGLLYQIASVLDERKLNIQRAMLTTEAYGVVDVFYLTDLEFNKLHDELAIAKLKKELVAALDGPEKPADPTPAAAST